MRVLRKCLHIFSFLSHAFQAHVEIEAVLTLVHRIFFRLLFAAYAWKQLLFLLRFVVEWSDNYLHCVIFFVTLVQHFIHWLAEVTFLT